MYKHRFSNKYSKSEKFAEKGCDVDVECNQPDIYTNVRLSV